jgi:hypothetical protein
MTVSLVTESSRSGWSTFNNPTGSRSAPWTLAQHGYVQSLMQLSDHAGPPPSKFSTLLDPTGRDLQDIHISSILLMQLSVFCKWLLGMILLRDRYEKLGLAAVFFGPLSVSAGHASNNLLTSCAVHHHHTACDSLHG